MDRYINAKTFTQFCTNQKELINILNHRMTGIETSIVAIRVDTTWVKRSLWVVAGLVMAIFTTLLTKAVVGG